MLPHAGRALELPEWRAIVTQATPSSAPIQNEEETAAVRHHRCSWSWPTSRLVWRSVSLFAFDGRSGNVCPFPAEGTTLDSMDVSRANRKEPITSCLRTTRPESHLSLPPGPFVVRNLSPMLSDGS